MYYSREEYKRVATTKGGVTIDHSILYRFLVNPICQQLVKVFPSWFAPNLMTFIGYLCNVVSLGLALYYLPNQTGEAPRWVYFTLSFLMISYMLLDNMDGKQAFRTGSSSSLGELFDHGCDSLTIAIGIIVTVSVLQVGPWPAVWLSSTGFYAFYLAHWQEYFSHFLELGYFNGPTEAECFAALIYFLTGIFGPQMWKGSLDVAGYSITVESAIMFGIAPLAAFTALQSIVTGLRLASSKGISPITALTQLIPFNISFFSACLWVYVNPFIYEENPVVFLTMFNFLFSYLVVNCIVQRMCDLPYRYFYKPIIPIILALANSLYIHFTKQVLVEERMVLYGLWIFYFILFFHFAVEIIQSFCRELKIRAFVIPYPNKATKKK